MTGWSIGGILHIVISSILEVSNGLNVTDKMEYFMGNSDIGVMAMGE